MLRTSIGQVVLVAVLSFVMSACLEKSDHYDTISEARSGRLFDKGWLPDFLPASTYDLEITTAVENSAGRGEFRFDPKEYPDLLAKLSTYNGGKSKIESQNQSIEKLLNDGYEARTYSSGATNWIFLCKASEALCKFFVWQ